MKEWCCFTSGKGQGVALATVRFAGALVITKQIKKWLPGKLIPAIYKFAEKLFKNDARISLFYYGKKLAGEDITSVRKIIELFRTVCY